MIGEIGEVIAKAREEKGLSQRKLAKLSGISNNILARIEKGVYSPSPKILRAISENIDVNYNDLMVMQSFGNDPLPRDLFIREYYASLNLKDLQKIYSLIKGNIFNNEEIIKELNDIDESKLTDENKKLLSNTIKDYSFINKNYDGLLKLLEKSLFYERFNIARKVDFYNE